MTPEPKSPNPPPAEMDAADGSPAPRRAYAPPRVKCLGSVRDLSLGSPTGPKMDGLPGGRRRM